MPAEILLVFRVCITFTRQRPQRGACPAPSARDTLQSASCSTSYGGGRGGGGWVAISTLSEQAVVQIFGAVFAEFK